MEDGSPLRRIIRSQIRASAAVDRLLPARFTTDGHQDFQRTILPRHLQPGQRIWDVGGGKNPSLEPDTKRDLGATVVGVDVDADELVRAADGSYDRTIAADITTFRGSGEADLVICQAVLEHVRDNGAAMAGLATLVRAGGTVLVFVPGRNSLYAWLNRLLPEGLKRRILFAVYPHTEHGHGFPAYYDRCTPKHFRSFAADAGLTVVEERWYYQSAYFAFLTPLHVVWRLWVVLFSALAGPQAAESFAMVLRKPGTDDREDPP